MLYNCIGINEGLNEKCQYCQIKDAHNRRFPACERWQLAVTRLVILPNLMRPYVVPCASSLRIAVAAPSSM